ncbi:hypothetical protein BDL97_11G109200 [Sphagnum fallax]|nr:hypothetical protein BDL97_11G109200 [Sphagnum fallax]
MADRYNNIFATINSLGLNVARQSAVDGAAAGCLCGVESPQYSASELIQLRAGGGGGGSDFYNSRRPLNCNDRGSDGSLDNDDEEGSSQKLRFTKPQVRLLEHTFQTLQRPNCYQKADLARELGVQPRQVDIWFQNRRARGKAKATDSDCDVLRQRCQDLIAENHHLNLLIQNERMSHESMLYNYGRSPASTHDQAASTTVESRSGPAVQIQMLLCNSCKKLKTFPPA